MKKTLFSLGSYLLVLMAPSAAFSSQVIPVGLKPCGVAYGMGKVFVTNADSHTVSVIDTGSGQVIQTILVGLVSDQIVYGGGSVFVPTLDGLLVVIDATTGKITTTTNIGYPGWIAYGDGMVYIAYVVSQYAHIALFDPTTSQVVRTIDAGAVDPRNIAYGAGRLFMANPDENLVTAIDVATGKNALTIPIGPQPYDLTYVGGVVYVLTNGDVDPNSSTVTLLDAGTGAMGKTIPVGIRGFCLVYGNGVVYTTGLSNPPEENSIVTAVDPAKGVVIKTIPVGKFPYGLDYDLATGNVYVACDEDNTVWVVSLSTK